MLREYLASCGFPCVVLSKEKNELLFKYSDDIILRDITRRCGIEEKTRIVEEAGHELNLMKLIRPA